MKPLRPQKYIYKLNSTYLDMNDYNVNIDLKDVFNNPECVISVGHSQLIKWIEELTGTENNYLEAERVRKEIRALKKLDNSLANKIKIKNKYNELYDFQFEPNLISVQFDKKQHFDNCCHSLIVNGQHFRRLYGTPGGLKMSTVLFISNSIYDEIYKRINNGRNHTKIKDGVEVDLEYSIAKLEAYYALTSSTSNAVSWPRMIVVKGTNVEFDADVIDVYDNPNGGDPIVDYESGKNKHIVSEINDGCGIMTPEYSRKITFEATGVDEIASGVCARCAFLKGMFFSFPIKEFAEKVAHNNTIIDAWGTPRNVMDADIIVTTSQLKLWDAYSCYEEYEEKCRENGYDFRLTKVSEELDESRNINYQFDQSYFLSDDDIEELISPTVEEIQDIISLDPRKSIVYLAGANLNDNNVMKSDVVAKALMVNQNLIYDPYVRNRIEKMIQKKIRLAKISTIDVDGNFALISGDMYAMCEDIFGLPVKGLLDKDEIFHKFWQDKGVTEVVCMRAPMCYHSNIVKQKIKYSEQADYWFRYIKDCIILNSWDTLRIAESGADCDGDILFTTNNKVLVEKHRAMPALNCQQSGSVKTKSKDITETDVAETNRRSFKSKVGPITNNGTAMLNLQANFHPDSAEWHELEKRAICIQHFQQLSIDSVKNGFKMTPMNPQWNTIQACLPKEGDDDTTIKIKKFNKPICAYRKPYFFIFRYNYTKAAYDKYIKKVDKKLKQKYHISLDDLLSKTDLSEELEREKIYFYNKCPVDMSPGTINRIAWAVSKKFEDFNNLPQVQFDKELIKSGVEYDMQYYYQVRDVYKEYKFNIANLVKKTKRDEIDEDEDGISTKAMINFVFKSKFAEACPNETMLCDILIDLLYDKPNAKSVVWDMCGNVIVNNLLTKTKGMLSYPERVDTDEEFFCCRQKFRMKQINVGGEEYGEV